MLAGDACFGEGKEEVTLLERFCTIFNLLLGSSAACLWVRNLQMILHYLFEKKLDAAFRVVHCHLLSTTAGIALKSSLVWLKLLSQNIVLPGDFESWRLDPAAI